MAQCWGEEIAMPNGAMAKDIAFRMGGCEFAFEYRPSGCNSGGGFLPRLEERS